LLLKDNKVSQIGKVSYFSDEEDFILYHVNDIPLIVNLVQYDNINIEFCFPSIKYFNELNLENLNIDICTIRGIVTVEVKTYENDNDAIVICKCLKKNEDIKPGDSGSLCIIEGKFVFGIFLGTIKGMKDYEEARQNLRILPIGSHKFDFI